MLLMHIESTQIMQEMYESNTRNHRTNKPIAQVDTSELG